MIVNNNKIIVKFFRNFIEVSTFILRYKTIIGHCFSTKIISDNVFVSFCKNCCIRIRFKVLNSELINHFEIFSSQPLFYFSFYYHFRIYEHCYKQQ